MCRAMLLLLPAAILLLSTQVLAETCPHPEDVEPCVCTYEGTHSEIVITCGSGTLKDIEGALGHLQGKKVKELVINNLKLGRVSSVFFWGLHIQKIHLHNCELESIADGQGKPAFLGLDNSLEELSITYGFRENNPLTHLNLIHLRRLVSLTLTSNNISTLPNEWLNRGPGSLAEVRLNGNHIRELGDKAFASLGNLKTLELSDNKGLKAFRRSMLPRPARNLVELTLSKNSLSSLPEDMFWDMPVLKNVFLDSNRLQRLPSPTWTRVWEQLDHLYLQHNALECDSHIEWTLELKRPDDLMGVCVAPEVRAGVGLKDVIDSGRSRVTSPSPDKTVNLIALLKRA